MTTHELAKELLKMPDVPVLVRSTEYGYPEVVNGAFIVKAGDDSKHLVGLTPHTRICRFKSSGGYSG